VTLDEALDHLYGVDADEFVAERKRLARELKDAGDGEAAAEVAKARKPTVAAWALNQLARRQRRDVDLLLDAGHRLRQAQEGVVGGDDRAAFEQAQKSEREALQRLTKLASELLGGASAQALSQISGTLRTAAVSEEGRELLARGRFVTPLESEGFDVFGALPARPPQERATKADRTRQAREELKQAKARVRELEREVRDAEQTAAKLEAEHEKAERAADSARAALTEAEREVERLEASG
jgi:DNA repair exonuclease SbcCD ATPase subunit